MRTAVHTGPIAFLSSRAMARAMVEYLCQRMQHRGVGNAEDYMAQFDKRTIDCYDAHVGQWGEDLASQISLLLREGEDRAYDKWRKDIYGDEVPREAEHEEAEADDSVDRSSARHMGSRGAGVVLDAGREDPEHP